MPIHGPTLRDMLEREIDLKASRTEITPGSNGIGTGEDWIAYQGALKANIILEETLRKTMIATFEGVSFYQIHAEIMGN